MELHAQHVDDEEDCSPAACWGGPLENKGHTTLMTRQATGDVEARLGRMKGECELPAADGGVLKA